VNKSAENISFFKKAVNHPFFKELDLKSSLVIVLGLLAFAIIFVDLTSELASEKDEIGVVLATLNKLDNPNINIVDTGLNIPVIDYIIVLQNVSINQTDVIKLHPDRAPPLV